MDPNATLNEIRQLSAKLIANGYPVSHSDSVRLAELFEALDNWILNGGFLPDAWKDEGRN